MATPEHSAPTVPSKPRRRLSFALVGQAGAVVGLVAGVVGLLFTFAPGLRPEKAPAATAKLEVTDLNNRATMREYLAAEGLPTRSLAASVLGRLGVLTTIRYTATGLDGKTLPLEVKLTSSSTGEVVCRHPYSITPASGAPPTFRAWLPFPVRPHSAGESFNLHVTLFPPDGKPPAFDALDRNGIPGLDHPQPGPPNSALAICEPGP